MTILRLMATLIPQGLGVTIPISLLLGVLMGLSRLSSDRETVAFQACGVSLFRMLVPLTLLGAVSAVATAYVLITALPDANQAFREITFRTVANRAEGDIKPRVFDEYFPGVVLYVREVSAAGGEWSDVLFADSRASEQPDIYVAEHGRVATRPRGTTSRHCPDQGHRTSGRSIQARDLRGARLRRDCDWAGR